MKSEPNLATSSRDEKFCIAILKSCAIYNEIKKFSCIEKLDFGGAQWKIRIF